MRNLTAPLEQTSIEGGCWGGGGDGVETGYGGRARQKGLRALV